MKKTYVKPELYFENFELSTNIAAGCVYKTGHAQDVCAYTSGGKKIFVQEVAACETTTQDETWNSLCYHNPNDSNLFTS